MATALLIDPASSPLTLGIHALRHRHDRARRAVTGLHVSQVCDDWHKTLYPAKYRGLSPEASLAYQEIGNTFEDLIAEVFRHRFSTWEKPAPRRLDGMVGSPDGAHRKTETIGETKACWASSRKFLDVDRFNRIISASPKFRRYEMQILCYLKIWGWRRAKLDVWFVNGDWKPPTPRYPMTIILRYSQAEIDENWRRVKQHAIDRHWLKAA